MRLLSNLDLHVLWIATLVLLMSVPVGFAQTPMPDGFLSDPKPVRVGLNLNHNVQPFIIGIDGRNTTTGPVKLAAPVIGPLLRVEGDVSTQAAARRPVELRASSCSGVMLPGQPCAMSLALPSDLGAGRYTIDVMLPGAEGGQSARTIPIYVRASSWLAGIVIAIGVALGALVTDWRSAGRPVTNRRIEAASLRARLEKLAVSSVQRAVEMRARELVRDLRALDAEIIAGKEVAQKLTDGEKKLVLLHQSELLLNAAAQPKGEAEDTFKTLAHRLTGTLESVEWQDAEVEKAGKALGAELAGFQRLHEAAVAIDTLAPHLADGVARSGSIEKIQTTWTRVAELRAQAFDRITGAGAAGSTEVAARAAALEAATRELSGMAGDIAAAVLSELRKAIAAELVATPPPTRTRKQRFEALDVDAKNLAASTVDARTKLVKAIELFRSFEIKLPGTESTSAPSQNAPTLLSNDSGLKFEWAVGVFQPAAGASAADLQQSVRRWDWITSLVMLAGIAAVGVLVLWVPNTAWGTVQDVILAILAGAGTRLAIGTIAIPGAK